jgi:potassium-transporting ATPase KdpC subunit
MKPFITSLRLMIATMLVCVAGYTAAILALAQTVTPDTAQGSLIRNQAGIVVGSRLIAQSFTNAAYFWPRPSAVDYKADAAGGSNKSPTSSDLTDRAKQLIAQYGATAKDPLPPELAAASGSGLDPNITEHAALYQGERVAKARNVPQSEVEGLIKQQAFSPDGGLTPDKLVNVLELNLALDRHHPRPPEGRK